MLAPGNCCASGCRLEVVEAAVVAEVVPAVVTVVRMAIHHIAEPDSFKEPWMRARCWTHTRWQCAMPVQRARASEQARECTFPEKNKCSKQVSS